MPNNFTFERAIPEKESENTIYSIAQDKQGFIWFATRDGLWKYDGQNTKEYRYDPSNTKSISSNIVRALLVDQQGTLWIGTTGGGLNKYIEKFDEFESYISIENDSSTLSHNDVLNIFQDKDGEIWICTEDGLNRMDQNTRTFKRYYLEKNPEMGYQNRSFLSCLEDRDGIFWIASYFNGLYTLDKETGDFSYVDLNKKANISPAIETFNLWSIFEDSHGDLWFSTRNQGLFKYNKTSDSATWFHKDADLKHRISDNIVYQVYEDWDGLFWIGTYNGLNIYDPKEQHFTTYYSAIDDPYSISNNVIWTILQDKSGTIWLAGGWEGFADKWDSKSKRFTPILSKGIVPPSPLQYNAMIEDKHGRLVVGTNNGMLVVPNINNKRVGGRIVIPKSKILYFENQYIPSIVEDEQGDIWLATDHGIKRIRFNKKGDDFNTIPLSDTQHATQFFYTIFRDSRNRLWFGSQYGLSLYVRETDSFKRYEYNPTIAGTINNRNVNCIYEDRNGIIWVGTYTGLNRLNEKTGLFTTFKHEHNNPESLANGIIEAIYNDSRGILWIGSSAGLSCMVNLSGIFRTFTVDDGLPGNFISAFYEDELGHLWVSTNHGISRLNITGIKHNNLEPIIDSMKVSFWNFNRSDGLIDMSFKRGAVNKLSNGEILFGSTYGINAIQLGNIKINKYVPPVVFTDLKVHNHSVSPFKGSKLLECQIGLAKKITLNYKQSVVTFHYVGLSYTNSKKNEYAYIMEGFDKEWIYAGNRKSATYTNLNPGEYIFRVKASNNDGIWNEEGASIVVKVLPPPWKTWPAFLIYLLILSSTIFGFIQLNLSKVKAESKFKVQRLESDKINEMNYFRSVFYTNISHEFRTPLTLIIGPLSDLMKSAKLNEEVKSQIKLIHVNALRMLRLINQLLDISKVEAGHIKLRVSKGNMVEQVSTVFEAFKIKAEKDNIKYRFYNSHEDIDCYFDSDKVEKILYNLLSNAFKHTPPAGKIDVLLFYKKNEKNRKYVEIVVHDSGPGIAPEIRKKIFERYFVLSESKTPWQSSTGIGLSLANQLTLVHKGKIDLESMEGNGSRFMVTLPVEAEDYETNEIELSASSENSELKEIQTLIDFESTSIQPVLKDNKNHPVALLVEDNKDVRDYIYERLTAHYTVITAANGKEGLELAIAKIPDIVISDVMMPEMDGFEFCKKLKTDERTSHIPIILLTAKIADDNRKIGYEMGADSYIAKPFQMDNLLARIDNLIESRNKLRTLFGKSLSFEPSDVSMSSIDESFIKKAIELIEKNISDPDFNVEALCDKIFMSRSQAFRKIKAITDLSIVEFIRMIRIKRAAQLLVQKCGTISEIANMVGFSDQDYFRKCFKEHFGQTPTKYMENADN